MSKQRLTLFGAHGLTITDSGAIDNLSGTDAIYGASITITTTGVLDVSGGMLTIGATPVTNSGRILVTNGSTLVLNDETVTNSVTASHTHAVTNGTIQVDADDRTLDLQGSLIDGGICRDFRAFSNSTGTSAIEDANITNTGTIESTGGALGRDRPCAVGDDGQFRCAGGQ